MMLLDALLPKRCTLCAVREEHGFCGDCRELLPWVVTACAVCGAQLSERGVCGSCLSGKPYYDHAVIPFRYRAPVSGQIKTLKYHDQLRYAGALGAMICRRVREGPEVVPEVLVPVPLHYKRLRERGFNQALEIARVLGRELGVEVNHSLLVRIKNTAPQTSLRRLERVRNVRGAFKAGGVEGYGHVGLVDDVVTSGSTANAAARELKRAGVKTVSVWAAARA